MKKHNERKDVSIEFKQFLQQNSSAKKDVVGKLIDEIETILSMNQLRYSQLQKKLKDDLDNIKSLLDEQHGAYREHLKVLKKESDNLRKNIRALKSSFIDCLSQTCRKI